MTILVRADNTLIYGGKTYHCALGKGGVKTDKVEGDGATPTGKFALHYVLYRADRIKKPDSALNVRVIEKTDGWCDDPQHANYNRPVTLPFPASHEKLYRDDHIYDIIVVLGHNDSPPVPGKGSAVFFHLARDQYAPTEGCVAVNLTDMLEILAKITPGETMEICL
ncbi:L,D-transpeptidase family protein [Terasakiella sp.]|uniref:L,D-transpeptidase family protein n=1 Tax=Terasakiella sp. TaxID=2034861 RepID=UPI003AA88B0B